jgi:glucose/arabinose dehydrogenase
MGQRWLVAAIVSLLSSAALADAADVRKNLHKLRVPAGFKVDVYAEVPGARQMALGQSTGTVYVGTRDTDVYAVVDRDKDRKADQVVKMLDDLRVGNGVAMHEGYLYVAEQHRIARYAAPGFDLNLPFKQMREVIYDQLPDKAHHGWRYIAFGPDGKLYATVGAPCNICDVQGIEASIIRMNPDGSEAEIYAHGVRNSVGIDFQPGTGTLYFTDNGVDTMGDDIPPDEFNAAPNKGMHFGFPYFAGGKERFQAWKDKTPPKAVTPPVVEFRAHSANLGFKFYTGKQFPAEYRGNAIVAQHGSWNRSAPIGYQLMRVVFDEKNQVKSHEVFIDGWLEEGEAWGRPTDVLQLPDGSLLISDDFNDVIYRVSYGESAATRATRANAPAARATIGDLVMPESAIAHPDGRIFVTEIGEFGKPGDGKVTVVHPDGRTETLVDRLDDPKGIDLFDNQLYVTDIDRVLRIDLKGAVTVLAAPEHFARRPVFLNDIEIDGHGTVYVSDSGDDAGRGAGVFAIDARGRVTVLLGDKAGIQRPNGLLMDGPGKLLVADFGSGKLFRLVPGPKGAKPSLTLLNSGFGGADGLVRDSDGALYISDWAGGKVWRLSDPKATPQLIAEGHMSSADIALSADGRSLLMPDMKAGTLVFLPLR